jgi:apolipoprotein D and lipocalin family protein
MPLSIRCSIIMALASLGLSGCVMTQKSRPNTVTSVDLDRYLGRWYVISNIPYFLEHGKVASYDTYAFRPDGKLTNDFTFRRDTVNGPEKTWHGTAQVIDTSTNATWKVSFVWPFSVTYKIFALDQDYRWAVVGTKDAGLLWVLARERQLPESTYTSILRQLDEKGIDPTPLKLVPQPNN